MAAQLADLTSLIWFFLGGFSTLYLTDYHTHSNCSPDGYVPMWEMAQAALAAGLQELCLTDHCDLLSQDGSHRELAYDWGPVLKQREELLSRYGGQLVLPMGLEFGMGHIDLEAAHAILSQPGLDFVIGSIHNHSEAAGGLDFYYQDYSTLQACYHALDDYFTSMEALALTDVYDVLGHIIYPLRYMERDGQHPSLERYYEQLRTILRTVVQNGRGIELNTYRGNTLSDWRPVLDLYKEVGGEIITLGSDAHVPQGVGKGIPEACQLLMDAGFRYVATYRGRKPQFIKL